MDYDSLYRTLMYKKHELTNDIETLQERLDRAQQDSETVIAVCIEAFGSDGSLSTECSYLREELLPRECSRRRMPKQKSLELDHKELLMLERFRYEDPRLSKLLTQTSFPIVLGQSSKRISVLSLGKAVSHSAFHTADCVYPLGFSCKRKFYLPDNNTANKVFYTCTVVDEEDYSKRGEPYFTISSTNNTWSGCRDELWSLLCNEFSEEQLSDFADLEDFFGLRHPTVQMMIEKRYLWIVDGYVPIAIREQ